MLCPTVPETGSAMAQPFDGEAPAAFRIGLVQMTVVPTKGDNIRNMLKKVAEAAGAGAKVVVLPEVWNSSYATSEFPGNAEPVPDVGAGGDDAVMRRDQSVSSNAMRNAAMEHGVWLVGGSVPEKRAGKVYNTCTVWSPEGRLVAKHRKIHLFDIDVPGKITFKESDTLSAGDELCTFDTPHGRFGVGICYDMRFPQLAALLRASGCHYIVYPGAFNTTTGPAHWELLQRGRALDNQCFVFTCSPARNMAASYHAYGHSTVVDPWGSVVATTGHEEAMVVAEIDPKRVAEVRGQIPVGVQWRSDLYATGWAGTDAGARDLAALEEERAALRVAAGDGADDSSAAGRKRGRVGASSDGGAAGAEAAGASADADAAAGSS